MADPIIQLREMLQRTMNPDKATRQQGEAALTQYEAQPGFTILLLTLIQQTASPTAPPADKALAQCAAVFFKNTVKRCWDPEEGTSGISDADKATIKSQIVNYMCTMPPEVQRQISEALSIISKSDFPAKWETLLPELVGRFSLEDFTVTNGVLATANSILKRFRWVVKSDPLLRELQYCLGILQKPLLDLFKQTATQVHALTANPSAGGHPDAYRALILRMEALRTMARVFYSLNWQDLPEFFEDNMGEWMGQFLPFLSFANATLSDPDEEAEPGPIERLQSAVVENANLYAEKYDEEFAQFLPQFAQAAWALLTRVGAQTKFDALASTSIRFLTSVVSKPHYASLFSGEEALAQILTQIVVPNLLLRESDEELFEDNPSEWILKDIEGNDSDSRRRCACDLVKGMCRQFEAQTTALCGTHIMTMLAQHAADPAQQWRSKDGALQLLVAVCVKASTAQSGVSSTNDAINVLDLVATHILPELQKGNAAGSSDVDSLPVIRADCIKFLATFRNQLPADTIRTALPLVGLHLRSSSVVVQSYAAYFVERVLTVKDRAPGQRPAPRFGRALLQPLLEPLFGSLFVILQAQDESFENEYVMKAVMRCLSVAREDVVPLTPTLLTAFNQCLERVCKNPRNPQFNHYLFESTAVLVGSACKMNPQLTEQFEAMLFPPFQTVLALDVAEFSPYVFQILAQLLEFRQGGLSEPYRALFVPLLAPANWERKGNCPALVRLVRAYLKQAPSEVVPQHLQAVLGVFQRLLSLKATEGDAFSLLDGLVCCSPADALSPYVPTVSQLLCLRLQANNALRYTKLMVGSLCVLAAKMGGAQCVDRGLETVQPGITAMLVASVWVKALSAAPPTGHEAKAAVMGMARMLCESDALKQNEGAWVALLGAAVSVLEPAVVGGGSGGGAAGAGDDEDGVGDEVVGFDGDAYSRLHFTGDADQDALPEVSDVGAAFCQSLAQLCASSPGSFLARTQQLPAGQGQALLAHCARAGVQLV